MIFINKMKNMKIYKTPMFLPTLDDDKKKQSAILLLTPNYDSSKKIMNSNMFVNKLRYASYYLERDLSYYINDKSIKDADSNPEEIEEAYNYLTEMNAAKRNALPDSEFGLPDKRKYPLDTEARVRSAIKFFNYASKDEEETLARNIKKAMKKFGIDDVKVGENNRFGNYYKSPVKESTAFTTTTPRNCPFCHTIPDKSVQAEWQGSVVYLCPKCYKKYIDHTFELDEDADLIPVNEFCRDIDESSLNLGDKVIVFNEDAKYNAQLKKLLFKGRLKRRNDVDLIYELVQRDCPFIKYTYHNLSRYQKRNLFVDLYFYNNAFFENNTWILAKGMNLYYDFMERLLNFRNIDAEGYKKKTIFIPIEDWDRLKDASVWNYRVNLNPISVIYQLMYTANSTKLKSLFKNIDLVFVGKDCIFKLNFSEVKTPKDYKLLASRLKSFVIKICNNEDFDYNDIDTTADQSNTPDVIRANIADKLDVNKGIDITPQLAAIDSVKDKSDINSIKNIKKKDEVVDKLEDKPTVDNLTANNPETDIKQKDIDGKKMNLATKVTSYSNISQSEDDAYDKMDEIDRAEILSLIRDLESDGDDKVDVSLGRASRITQLDKKLMDTTINGKTVRDIINEKEPEPITTEIKVASPNKEWESLSYMNFDKNYDIDKDIVNSFHYLSKVSYPISIRNLKAENTSTSEDRVMTYTAEMEDYRGKRFTVKLDIPIMVDNRFLLRGNYKSIQTQFYNMPIIKTDVDTCQIISNYMKIFVYRYGDSGNKSLPLVTRFLKALDKYTGSSIKIYRGNAKKVSNRYNLPMDYINMSGVLNKIETSDFIIYFNQDEIRSKYTIDESVGIPYGYSKKDKTIMYYANDTSMTFINRLYDLFVKKYPDFAELVEKAAPPSNAAYSRCSIMSSKIPLALICCYHEGLRKTLEKAAVNYRLADKLTKEDRSNPFIDWVKFKDGYVIYDCNYESSLLMNGLKVCSTEMFSLADIDNKNIYLEFLDDFGGRIKADGLDNFYDLMIDPITKEILEYYKMPTDYVSILLYANSLLSDNKYIKHTNMASRRIRRYELIAVYTYKVLADAYSSYSYQLKHSRSSAEFYVKQSAVIDKFLVDTITSDDSAINALRDVETTNSITTKGPSGMNSDRAYSLDKRTFDPSMINVVGMSTGHAATVGVTRQATIDSNVEGVRGFVKESDGDISKMNTAKTLTATEALTPFGTTRDDPTRTAMTFGQTAKHMVRTEVSDPLLVTSGADEVMPYLTTNNFAFKAKKDGEVIERTDDYAIVKYKDDTYDYIKLNETIEKNSDGGYFVPLQLTASYKLKVGSKIRANDILAYDTYSFSNSVGESDNLAYNVGTLAKVAVINSDEGFEDSGIISEGMAEKLATRIDLQHTATLDKDTILLSMVKVGDEVEAGDNLIVYQPTFEDEDTKVLLKNLTANEVSELGKKVVTSKVTGRVSAIKIFRTVELDELSESLRKVVSKYESKYNTLEKTFDKYNLDKSNIPAHYILPATGKLKKCEDSVLIEIYVEYKDAVGIGDKIVFFSANKAIIKNILDKDNAPYTDFRPNEKIDAFVSEVSIDKRMVTSTIIYGSLQKLLIELDRSVKDIMGIEYDDSKV